MTPVVLLVLAKAPHPGQVKTRLCAPHPAGCRAVGGPPFPSADPVQAADLAAAALLDTIDAVRAVPDALPVLALDGGLAGACRAAELAAALDGVPTLPQSGGSLGERIAAAHADAARLAPGSAVLQIGMDTPQVHAALLERCARELLRRGTDAVLGPAADGGWWALGLRDPLAAACIVAVPMSRADTGARTAAALRGGGLRVRALPELRDVDTVDDAAAVAAVAPGGRFAAAVRGLAATDPARSPSGTAPGRCPARPPAATSAREERS